MTHSPWDRLLWGVEYVASKSNDRLLIGSAWDPDERIGAHRPSEPTRALLFRTRSQARDWCRERNSEGRMQGRFRPARVREKVEVVK